MTATLQAPPTATAARTSTIPMRRLVAVELRKLVDTRAGFWLTASIGLSCVVVVVAMLIADRGHLDRLNFDAFMQMMNIPTTILLPVLAILLVTGEWSQRTALTTFTMEPRRERVIVAKLVTVAIAAAAAVALSLLVSAIGTLVADLMFADPAGAWTFTSAGVVNTVVIQLFGLLLGFGLAAALLSTPGAIVGYFALPTLMVLVTSLVPAFKNGIGQWVDITTTNAPFQTSEWASGGDWLRLAVSALIWIAIPMAYGIVRVMRSEVK